MIRCFTCGSKADRIWRSKHHHIGRYQQSVYFGYCFTHAVPGLCAQYRSVGCPELSPGEVAALEVLSS